MEIAAATAERAKHRLPPCRRNPIVRFSLNASALAKMEERGETYRRNPIRFVSMVLNKLLAQKVEYVPSGARKAFVTARSRRRGGSGASQFRVGLLPEANLALSMMAAASGKPRCEVAARLICRAIGVEWEPVPRGHARTLSKEQRVSTRRARYLRSYYRHHEERLQRQREWRKKKWATDPEWRNRKNEAKRAARRAERLRLRGLPPDARLGGAQGESADSLPLIRSGYGPAASATRCCGCCALQGSGGRCVMFGAEAQDDFVCDGFRAIDR